MSYRPYSDNVASNPPFTMYRDKLYKLNSAKYKATSQKMLVVLARKPYSKHELVTEMGLNLSTVSNYIYFLKQAGMIYIAEWQENPLGKPTAKYKFGTNSDAEYVCRKKYKSPVRRKEKPVDLKMPRCDVAAQWMLNPC